MNGYSDISKYKKKKQSSTSKSSIKSKHKHEYIECLLITSKNKPYRSKYCKFCGKIDNIIFGESERLENGLHKMITDEEIYKKYKNLKNIYVDDIWNLKYIPVNVNKNSD